VGAGRSSRDRLESALASIAEPGGEGGRAFLTCYAEEARVSADQADARSRKGAALGPLDGVIVSIKDLFDVAGEPTRAGARVLAAAPPAVADAPVVERLRQAGAVIIGKTNMSEFAFSGVGANPHYGTPGNPFDRRCVPGGSTSGGAVAVADSMCEIAIGTDTGGSTRIPAALCGLVGFKPSQHRVPRIGAFPLSPTLDSVGPMARSVAACAQADAVIAGEDPWEIGRAPLAGLRCGIPQGFPLRELDQIIAAKFAQALAQLERNGVQLSEPSFPLFDDMERVNSVASISQVESYAAHKERLAAHGEEYDPNVRARIEAGRKVSEADFQIMMQDRAALVRAMDVRLADLDALVLPTTPIVAPTLALVSTTGGFIDRNRLLLRNTAFANFFDLCAISLPLPRTEGPATGLMLVARNGQDRRLFQMATAVETALAMPQGA
jgi:aspartyl-tRNA(Asn)/glutamyl-tRNA(Gln) amidotransferase subunit A